MLTLKLPEEVKLWEVVAVAQIVQTVNAAASEEILNVSRHLLSKAHTDLLNLLLPEEWSLGPIRDLNLDNTFRVADSGSDWYGDVLARKNSLYYAPLSRLTIPHPVPSAEKRGIVVCPFAIKTEMSLGYNVWRPVVRHLSTYDEPVYLMGEEHERLDALALSEADILSTCTIEAKLKILVSARVIVGVPNAWTWLATAWHIKTLHMIPENIPSTRWGITPSVGDDLDKNVFWLGYDPTTIQLPVVLAALRKIMNMMG